MLKENFIFFSPNSQSEFELETKTIMGYGIHPCFGFGKIGRNEVANARNQNFTKVKLLVS